MQLPALLLRLRELQHRERHDVRRAALDRRVDGRPERVPLRHSVAFIHRVRQLPLAPQQGAHQPLFLREVTLFVLPLLHLWPRRVPLLHGLLGLLLAHPPVLGKAERRLAVGDREVEDLRLAALGGELVLEERRGRLLPPTLGPVPLQETAAAVHRLLDVVVHAQRGAAVEVAPGLERLLHGDAVRHGGEQPELELPVVRHHQRVARRRDERRADLVAVLLQRGLVLQVGPPGAEPARLRVEVERAVHAALLAPQVVALQRL
mmetsp:Transcript_22833/g.77695  ORF Transcript_22833/g.77695 Transcript_22833/m.77695 type:complete len:262 (+) Transcript_22833:424-1209(+)